MLLQMLKDANLKSVKASDAPPALWHGPWQTLKQSSYGAWMGKPPFAIPRGRAELCGNRLTAGVA